MIRISPMYSAALTLAILANVSPASAQTMMVTAPNPDADRLAQTIRVLATDPRDLSALVEAGRLSTRLNDTSAALAFFQRAESVSPGDPRIAAGRAAVLVQMKRPGEALRLFQSAEARGASVRDYSADRGFAYDLLGQPGLAQADYRVAMQRERGDDLIRRYALSLGISGAVEEANALLDPLLRRSDRAAWRARAFILAMNGDMAGAEKIASSMMPGNMAQSLAPFFRRLSGLSPADRAFAVHFGELSPTQARLADARFAPSLPRYVPAPRPVQVAAVRQAPPAATSSRNRRSARDRRRSAPIAVAAVTPAPSPPATAPLPQPSVQAPVSRTPFAEQRTALVQPIPASPAPARTVFAEQRGPIVQPLPASPAAASSATAPAPTPVRPVASPSVAMASNPGLNRTTEPMPAPAGVVSASAPPAAALPTVLGNPTPVQIASNSVASGSSVATGPTPSASTPALSTAPASAALSSAPPGQPQLVQPSPVVAPAAGTPDAAPEPPVAAARPEPTPPGPVAVGEEDSVLASIVANLTIPAAELEAANSTAAPPPVPVPQPKPAPVREVAKPEPKPEPAKPAATRKSEAAKPAAAKAGKDAMPEKGAKTAVAKAKPAAKPDPERVWVQVAGGANASDLAKAWKAVTGKAPTQFRGKSGWWTPVRASNRLLTGPFKTEAEGQAFVNALSKAGVSGFVFTSEAGQKINKIGEK